MTTKKSSQKTINLALQGGGAHGAFAWGVLDKLLEDVETVIESNGRLPYIDRQGNQQYTLDIIILSIDTDEGVLEPYGVAEMQISVHY